MSFDVCVPSFSAEYGEIILQRHNIEDNDGYPQNVNFNELRNIGSAPLALNIIEETPTNNSEDENTTLNDDSAEPIENSTRKIFWRFYCPASDHKYYVPKNHDNNNENVRNRFSKKLKQITPGVWYHFDIECKEGYMCAHNPFVKIFIDGKLELFYRGPNCYNVKEAAIIKYGLYFRKWASQPSEEQKEKSIYFKNVNLLM